MASVLPAEVEADAHSRYTDYTCSTPWEHFVNQIESVLRRWPPEAGACQEAVAYAGLELALKFVVHHGGTAVGSPRPVLRRTRGPFVRVEEDTFGPLPNGLAPAMACTWFGLRHCVVLECYRKNEVRRTRHAPPLNPPTPLPTHPSPPPPPPT